MLENSFGFSSSVASFLYELVKNTRRTERETVDVASVLEGGEGLEGFIGAYLRWRAKEGGK